jgi:hypothetical protein
LLARYASWLVRTDHSCSVLIVDDNDFTRKVLRNMIQKKVMRWVRM